MKVLYVSDLDGTLLTSKECISTYSIDIINRLVDKGMFFTYATARSLTTAQTATKGLSNNFPVIVYNGALIVNPYTREFLYSVTFDDELKDYIVNVLISLGIYPLVYSVSEGKEKLSWVLGRETFAMGRYLERRQNDERLNPVYHSDELKNGEIFYFNCMGDKDLLYKAHDIFSRDSRLTCLIHQETYQQDFWLEIMCKNATKAEAVKKMKELLDCDKVVSFGDSINDIPMFDVSDEKYAVMNADECLKERSTGVIGYCEEDGVAKWLIENTDFKE